MKIEDLITNLVPADLFDIKEEGDMLERAQHLIEQCHPGTTAMKLVTVDAELAEADIPYAMSNRALHGFMHGGCYFTVGDTLTALMAFFQVEKPGETTLTMDASIRYLRPIREETVRARARLVKKEDKLLDYVCEFLNPDGKRAARAKYRYVVTEPRQ